MLMPGIFLGVQFQAHVFFWVRNMKLRLTPRHLYCEYPPLGKHYSSSCKNTEL